MTDHQHLYVVGDDHCKVCYERRDAIDVKLERLQAMTEEAMSFARTILQEIEDEAADRMLHAEWKDGA